MRYPRSDTKGGEWGFAKLAGFLLKLDSVRTEGNPSLGLVRQRAQRSLNKVRSRKGSLWLKVLPKQRGPAACMRPSPMRYVQSLQLESKGLF